MLLVFLAVVIYWLFRYITGPRRRVFGVVMRVITIIIAGGLLWLIVRTSSGRGLPGTLEVTLIFALAAWPPSILWGCPRAAGYSEPAR